MPNLGAKVSIISLHVEIYDLRLEVTQSNFWCCSYLQISNYFDESTLYFNKEDNQAAYFTNKGLGLGIVRDDSYAKYVQQREFSYKPGDILILYTDGITEASNFKAEEFGYDRLSNIINENAALEVAELQKKIITDLYEFCGQSELDDDYTTVIVKFKQTYGTNRYNKRK